MYKLSAYEFRHTILPAWWKLFAFSLLFVFFYVCFYFEAFHLFVFEFDAIGGLKKLGLTLGDILLLEVGGILPVTDLNDVGVKFPISWFIAAASIFYIVISSVIKDPDGSGTQALIRLKKAKSWWYTKCASTLLLVTLSFCVGYGALVLMCKIQGIDCALMPNQRVFNLYFSALFTNTEVSQAKLFLYFCILPWFVISALSMALLVLSLFVKPMYAFAGGCAYYVAGIFYPSPFFISNYAMPVRSSVIDIYNFDFFSGSLICMGIIALCVYIGSVRVNRKDFV